MSSRSLAWSAAILPLSAASVGCSSSHDYDTHYALGVYAEPQGVKDDNGSVCMGMPMSAPGAQGGMLTSRLWLQASWSNDKGQTSYDLTVYHFDSPQTGLVILGDGTPPPDAVALAHWTFGESLAGPRGAFEATVVDGAVTTKIRIAGSYEGCDATKPTSG
jgi:hypothetical protein